MAFKKGPITFSLAPDTPDKVFEEKGNTVGMIRKVGWGSRDPKLEVRKWSAGDDGKEIAGKGYTFMTEEGPHELTEKLTELGYGNTGNLLKTMQGRADFEASLTNTIGMKKVVEAKNKEIEISEEDYYDPKSLISE